LHDTPLDEQNNPNGVKYGVITITLASFVVKRALQFIGRAPKTREMGK